MRLARSRGGRFERELPSKMTSPFPGRSSPASNLMSVDLPDPFAPMSAPIAPRGSDNETSTTAGNKEYENSKCSACISVPVVEELFGIGKTLRMQRLCKQLRSMANKLAWMNHRRISHGVDSLFAHGANFPKFIPYRYRVFTEVALRALDHINDHFRI